MNFQKKYLKAIVFAFLFLVNTSLCFAQSQNLTNAFELGGKMDAVADKAGYNIDTATPNSIIGTVIKTFLSLLGIIFLILMLYGGYLWMTDRGGGKSVEKGKEVIQAAVIGLGITLASYAITYFVISKMQAGALQ